MKTLVVGMMLLVASVASAAKEKTRAGVPVESLTPAGMTRLSVSAPMASGLPVRLVYGSARKPEVIIDVLVAADAATARSKLDRWRRTVAITPDSASGIGDVAFAGEGLVGFARANVMVIVRRVAGKADVMDVALAAEAAVDAAPAGSAKMAAVQPRVPALAVGESAVVSLPADLIAADVRVAGPATVRRQKQGGWRITRTGQGAIAVTVRAVDGLLRSTP